MGPSDMRWGGGDTCPLCPLAVPLSEIDLLSNRPEGHLEVGPPVYQRTVLCSISRGKETCPINTPDWPGDAPSESRASVWAVTPLSRRREKTEVTSPDRDSATETQLQTGTWLPPAAAPSSDRGGSVAWQPRFGFDGADIAAFPCATVSAEWKVRGESPLLLGYKCSYWSLLSLFPPNSIPDPQTSDSDLRARIRLVYDSCQISQFNWGKMWKYLESIVMNRYNLNTPINSIVLLSASEPTQSTHKNNSRDAIKSFNQLNMLLTFFGKP